MLEDSQFFKNQLSLEHFNRNHMRYQTSSVLQPYDAWSHTYSLCVLRLTSDPAGCAIYLNPRWKVCWINQSEKKKPNTWDIILHRVWLELKASEHPSGRDQRSAYRVIIFHCQPSSIDYSRATLLRKKMRISVSPLRIELEIFSHISYCGLDAENTTPFPVQAQDFVRKRDGCLYFTSKRFRILTYFVFIFDFLFYISFPCPGAI